MHSTKSLVLPAMLLMSVTSISCTEESQPNDTTSSGSSSSSSSSSSGSGGMGGGGMGGDGGMAPQSVVGTFGVIDALTNKAIEGASAASGADMQKTNSEGKVSFNLLPGSPYEIVVTPMQHLPIHFFGVSGNANFGTTRGLFAEMTISQLAGALGENYDPTKAIISIIAVGPDLKYFPESFQADTNVKYGFAVVPNSASPVGFSKGNSSLAGDESSVYLINVDSGAVPLTITPPMGKSCTVYPSSMAQGAEKVVAYANAVSTLSFVCQ